MNFDVFSFIYNIMAVVSIGTVTAMNVALSGAVAPVLRIGLIIMLAVMCFRDMFNPKGSPLNDLTIAMLSGCVALWMISETAGYGTWARDVILSGLAKDLPQAISRVIPGAAGLEMNGSVFMKLWLKAWAAGLLPLNNLPWSLSALGMALVVVVFWIVAALGIARSFFIWMRGFVILSVLIGIGPLFAGLWLFKFSRGWFHGWLNTVMANLVLMILSTALLVIVVLGAQDLLGKIAENVRGQNNEATQIGMLVIAGILFYYLFDVSKSLPAIAGSIGHGSAGYLRDGGMRVAAAFQRMRASGRSNGGGNTITLAQTNPGGLVAVPVRAPDPPGQSLSNP